MGKYNAPATVPIPSPSPTDSSCSQYDQNLSYPQSICSSAPSPSPSNASTTYNQPTYINTPYQQPQTNTTTPLAPLIDYINTFSDVDN